MTHKTRYNKLIATAAVTIAAGLVSCTDHDGLDEIREVPKIDAQLTFALPQRIVVGQTNTETRMGADVVQYDGNTAVFRGLQDVHVLCFDANPTATSRSTYEMQLAGTGGRTIDLVTNNDYSIVRQVKVPIGTTHFAFYARAIDNPSTHADRMKYGTLNVGGLDPYSDNADIAFAHVPICTSAEAQGGSTTGQALVGLLNNLMQTTSTDAAPDDKWATAPDERLTAAYQAMTGLKTLSSASVQRVLGKVYKVVSNVPSDYAGYDLATKIAAAIASACATAPTPGNETITLKDEYQGFPADLNLPEGAARIEWDASTQKYVTPATQVYGRGLNIPSMTDYVYPANLQYMVASAIVASDSLALPGDPLAQLPSTTDPSGGDPTTGGQSKTYQNWQQLINDAYANGYSSVKETTQSVAMVKQVQYGVGRLDTRVRLDSRYLYDAYGKMVDCKDGFKLKAILLGGQQEAGYDFQPKTSAHEYVIYDTGIIGGPLHVSHTLWTPFNYTLALPTAIDKTVLVALELVNNGPDFQGADGLIAHDATFYLVAKMVPNTASNYSSGNLDRIIIGDHFTKVDMRIMTGNSDVNGDGVPDTDINGDGVPDHFVKDGTGKITGIDLDGDGTPDECDYNFDGTKDKIVSEDTDHDGTIDRIGWDTNGDGKIDIPIDSNDDGSWPDTPTVPAGLATATYGIPDLVEPEAHRAFGLSVNLSWNQGIIFDDIPLGVKDRE